MAIRVRIEILAPAVIDKIGIGWVIHTIGMTSKLNNNLDLILNTVLYHT